MQGICHYYKVFMHCAFCMDSEYTFQTSLVKIVKNHRKSCLHRENIAILISYDLKFGICFAGDNSSHTNHLCTELTMSRCYWLIDVLTVCSNDVGRSSNQPVTCAASHSEPVRWRLRHQWTTPALSGRRCESALLLLALSVCKFLEIRAGTD